MFLHKYFLWLTIKTAYIGPIYLLYNVVFLTLSPNDYREQMVNSLFSCITQYLNAILNTSENKNGKYFVATKLKFKYTYNNISDVNTNDPYTKH